ncbi:hypothetical protein SEA_NANOSMITE_47 [Mycobacterium phage Nanosmite]|nr:hypothetical protein SEA_NANOSMITE_47 [Mycobacterium phage Nanosmite]
MTEKDPREEKLPRWARELLGRARIRADRADYLLEEHLKTVKPTPIWYGDYQNKIYVPVDFGYQTVYFSTTGLPSEHIYDEIGVSFRRGVIQVQGGRRLQITPNASNSFDIAPHD